MKALLLPLIATLLCACGGGDAIVEEEKPQQKVPVLAWTAGRAEGDYCTTTFSCGAGGAEMSITAKIVNGKCTVPPTTIAGFCAPPKGP